MTARLSTGLVNALAGMACFKDAFADCVIDVYSGAQPASPDSAATGTLLVTVSNASGAYTPETAATGTLTIAGTSGSIDTVTVNTIDVLGASVPFNTDLTTTAADVATQINRNPKNVIVSATSSGAVVTLTAVQGLGALANGWGVNYTASSMSATYAPMASGVSAINGLNWDVPVGGVITKLPSQTWQGTVAASGVAGWFRMRRGGDSGAGASTTAIRYDGAISTSGAEMNLGSLSLTAAAPFILTTAAFTVPTS